MANPRRRRRRAVTTIRVRANPVKRRRRSYRRNPMPRAVARSYSINPARRRRRRAGRSYRRNPISLSRGRGKFSIMKMLPGAMAIGAGAAGVELLMGYLPIPANLKVGPLRFVTKGAIAVAAGFLIAKFINKSAGEAFALGGIAIATHDAVRGGITQFMPGAQFGGYNWDKYGYNIPMQSGFPGGLGYYSPAATMPMTNMGAYVGSAGMGDYQA